MSAYETVRELRRLVDRRKLKTEIGLAALACRQLKDNIKAEQRKPSPMGVGDWRMRRQLESARLRSDSLTVLAAALNGRPDAWVRTDARMTKRLLAEFEANAITQLGNLA